MAKIESGQTDPNLTAIYNLKNALRCSPGQFIEDYNESASDKELLGVEDLNREQLQQLKATLLEELGRSLSYSQLFTIDDAITDDEIKEAYKGFTFSQDDFLTMQQRHKIGTKTCLFDRCNSTKGTIRTRLKRK